MAEKQERGRETGEVVNSSSDRLGEPAKEREGSQGHDQRWQFQTCDQSGIQSSGGCSDQKGAEGSEPRRQSGVTPELSKRNRAESEKRTYRQINAPGQNDRCHYEGEQAEFHAQADNFKRVPSRGEVFGRLRKNEDLHEEHCDEQCLEA